MTKKQKAGGFPPGGECGRVALAGAAAAAGASERPTDTSSMHQSGAGCQVRPLGSLAGLPGDALRRASLAGVQADAFRAAGDEQARRNWRRGMLLRQAVYYSATHPTQETAP